MSSQIPAPGRARQRQSSAVGSGSGRGRGRGSWLWQSEGRACGGALSCELDGGVICDLSFLSLHTPRSHTAGYQESRHQWRRRRWSRVAQCSICIRLVLMWDEGGGPACMSGPDKNSYRKGCGCPRKAANLRFLSTLLLSVDSDRGPGPGMLTSCSFSSNNGSRADNLRHREDNRPVEQCLQTLYPPYQAAAASSAPWLIGST